MNTKIKTITISPETSLLASLVRMDDVSHKLLVIMDADRYIGLISIGDIQRAIIKNFPLDTHVATVMRDNYIIADENTSTEEIKQKMISMRLEFMPVVGANQELKRVYFYEDLLNAPPPAKRKDLHVPVVIMAGGYGTRMRPLTNIIPKPLIPIGDKSMLEVIIDSFKKIGCQDFYLSVNYKAEMIKFYMDSVEHGVNIEYFKEDKPYGTAGSLHLLKERLFSTFFVSNCDIIIDQDYSEIYEYHKEKNNELTLVASVKNYSIPYGTVESGEDGQLIDIKEKPQLPFMINCGLYILEHHLLQEIPENEFFHITHLIEKIMKRGGRVGVFPVSEKSWSDIGEWKEYQKVININPAI
ncbi:nucleotidyltransferase family protein [Chitinophaga horti]|uniref:Nucleotidyltransferase family protein n=1 Tax=Chitinophaga horti TaxID=2920382 RepID=A0ABY6IYT3_9BACT|nr:nucleotidyltransferase family protein [Chitinophaga horti]UYQ92428.1 nucleotidyltransferase family protein [Chitinophaga horti]